MPFCKWVAEPVFLGRTKPRAPDENSGAREFHRTTNAQLANCLRQLASVAGIADRIFGEIGCECRAIVERTQRLRSKIGAVQDVVDNLNARAVKVPVSDLSQAARLMRLQKPFARDYQPASNLFLPSTRPPCVDALYARAAPTPVGVIRGFDQYRTDGLSSCDLFVVTPVLGGDKRGRGRARRYLDIETRKPANFSLDKSKQDAAKSGTSSLPPVVSPSRNYILKQKENNLELERLPSPEEQAMLTALEYPSSVVPVETSGVSFQRMSLLRRSLIHADFIIKRKKSKRKSKRRHTFCEGQNRDIEQAIRNVTSSSCQTDDMLDTTLSSSNSLDRTLSKRRSRSALDNSQRKNLLEELNLESLEQDSKDLASEEDKEKAQSKTNTTNSKKSKSSTLRSKSFNPLSTLSAAISIAAVKMRNTARGVGSKQDDGRSSSGNWSASSSTRASVDSDHQHAVSPVDGVSSPSRNSVGKDSVLSDATHFDPHNRSRDEILLIQSLSSSPIKRKKFGALNLPWEPNGNSQNSSTPTPDFTSLRSPYAGRRGISDDGDSSVYSVDTDGYYTSMHTDSGLWSNVVANLNEIPEIAGFRPRKESQSSVSTADNSSINSFLSKTATECSSNSGGSKEHRGPDPPTRVSSCYNTVRRNSAAVNKDQEVESSDKSDSPQPQNGSTSESEHEVKERIRVKTTISANRYPSLCAVSPETSDDEVGLSKNKAVGNLNVTVAEVHREEKPTDKQKVEASDELSKFLSCSPIAKALSVNMYRSETPQPSHFQPSAAQNNQPIATSSPRSGVSVSTFTSDFNDTRSINSSSGTSSKLQDLDSCFDSDDDITVTGSPVCNRSSSDKSLIPLKYAQRITVTPIARTESTSSVTGTIKRTPSRSCNSPSTVLTSEKPLTIPFNQKDNQPSYISFQSPDSPISSTSSFGKFANSSPTSSLPRPVARVTLDPSGKVVYSSNSLGRISNLQSNKSAEDRKFSTLPSSPPTKDPRLSHQYLSMDSTGRNKSINSHLPTERILSDLRFESTSSQSNSKKEVIFPETTSSAKSNFMSTAQNNSQGSSTQSKTSEPSVTPLSTFSQPRLAANYMQTSPLRPGPASQTSTHPRINESNSPNAQNSTSSLPTYQYTQSSSVGKKEFTFRPSRGGRICRSYFPSHLISPPGTKTNQFATATYSPPALNSSKNCSSLSTTNSNASSPADSLRAPDRSSQEIKSSVPSSRVPDQISPKTGPRYLSSVPSSRVPDLASQKTSLSYSPSQPNSRVPNVTSPKTTTLSYSSRVPISAAQKTSISIYSPSVPNTLNDSSSSNNEGRSHVWSGRAYNSQSSLKLHGLETQQCKTPPIASTDASPQKNSKPLLPPDLIPCGESPPSTLDITSSAGSHRLNQKQSPSGSPNSSSSTSPDSQKNLKSMSASELFAIIHDSKKKHNIRSESELSMSPLSSRSVSPALSQSSVSKLQPVETGILVKRGSDFSPQDKSKWCNSMPSSFRRSTQEKTTNTKPTSMHDFKMLLLQARTGNGGSSRPSAAELLKVSPTRSSTPVPQSPSSKPPSSSPFKSLASPHYTLNPSYSPSHGTVPMKRSMRTRSPYLTRYDSAYPPILEDCSEEVENNEDSVSPVYKLPSSVQRPTPVVAKPTSTWV